ncbi:MAG: DUF721 domain-containing protein [Flavobacteriales bacterium]|nr:DUF721 domain-containing protein [Bacteroidota bacterium]MCB9239968.1 DUF721 domain-containing protein [Flavobacteriales bacterium]
MQDERSLKDLMGSMFDNYKMSGKLNETRLTQNWEELVGRTIARNTKKLVIRDKVLCMYIDSPALKNDLTYYESTIVEKVNQFLGQQSITSIKVY